MRIHEISSLRGPLSALEIPGPPGPPLVFSHANGFNALTYLPLFERLRDRWTIWALDARGHGRSTLDADPHTLRDWNPYRDDLLAFLDHLDRPVYLAGHSLGSVVSLMAADARRHEILGQVMIEPVIFPQWLATPVDWLIRAGFRSRIPHIRQALARRRDFPDLQSALAAYQGRGAFKTWDPAFLAAYLEGGLRVHPSGDGLQLACDPLWEAATFAAPLAVGWAPLRRASQPTLICHGSHGTTFPAASLRRAQRINPNVSFRHFEGGSHFIPMESAGELAEVMVAFLLS